MESWGWREAAGGSTSNRHSVRHRTPPRPEYNTARPCQQFKLRHYPASGSGGRRKHPVYRFYDKDGGYICKVRYGAGTANALQRGFWTHTKNGINYFDSVTNGWIDYSHNLVLVKLFSHALLATSKGHEAALVKLKEDIDE